MNQISMDTVVEAARDLLSCDLAGETAILHLKSGTYYTLNNTGAAIWTLIAEPRAVRDVHAFLMQRFDVAAERCSEDLLLLFRELWAHDLIAIRA